MKGRRENFSDQFRRRTGGRFHAHHPRHRRTGMGMGGYPGLASDSVAAWASAWPMQRKTRYHERASHARFSRRCTFFGARCQPVV